MSEAKLISTIEIGTVTLQQFKLADGSYVSKALTDSEGKLMAWIDGKMWDVIGKEPTDDERQARMNDYHRDSKHNPQLGHKLECECCGGHNTRWLRHQYWMCFDCGIWWENIPVYDVAGYEADSREAID
jgi:hypothetical protein